MKMVFQIYKLLWVFQETGGGGGRFLKIYCWRHVEKNTDTEEYVEKNVFDIVTLTPKTLYNYPRTIKGKKI